MLIEPLDWSEPSQKIVPRAAGDWLESLTACSMVQHRRKIREGAEPAFVLDEFLLSEPNLVASSEG